jgi:HEPN domain-containing protein
MNKDEHIKYWVDIAEKDWEVSEDLFNSKKFVYSLFFAHLTLEKLCKAHWVKNNAENHPPRIHNLVKLISNIDLGLSEDDFAFMERMNDFQIEGRYPDYLMKIYKVCTSDYTKNILEQVKIIKECLQKKLQ